MKQTTDVFEAFYKLYKILDQGVEFSWKVGKQELKLKAWGVDISDDSPYNSDNFYIDCSDYSIEGVCDLSEWLESEFGVDYREYVYADELDKRLSKLFKNDLKAFKDADPLIINAYWEIKRNLTRKISDEKFLERFRKAFDQLIKERDLLEEKKKQRARKETHPEEFVSIDGILFEKTKIKKIAETL